MDWAEDGHRSLSWLISKSCTTFFYLKNKDMETLNEYNTMLIRSFKRNDKLFKTLKVDFQTKYRSSL